MGLKEFLSRFEDYLYKTLSGVNSSIKELMLYAAADGGKRVRPTLVYLGANAGDGDVDKILPLALGVELIHSYSLVHDDMPEMDNDDFRRGKLSAHKQFGAGRALLLGDGLLSLAACELQKADRRAANEILSAAFDMVLGQYAEYGGLDTADEYLNSYKNKTAALIKGAFLAGFLAGGGDEKFLDNARDYAENLGIAFQLADDLLDDGDSIISVLGKEQTEQLLADYSKKSILAAETFKNAAELKQFAISMWQRKK